MSKMKTTECFINEATEIHNGKYIYDESIYIGAHKKLCIKCPIHGAFWQTPNTHLKGGGCPKCSSNYKWTTEEWVNQAEIVNNFFYTYNNAEYVNKNTKIIVTCPIHGDFKIIPYDHLNGHGCSKCVGKYHYSTKEWIKKAKEKHGDIYDYSKTLYINSKSKVCVGCKKHGYFWVNASHHLQGVGCNMCGNASKLEIEVKKYFDENKIKYIQQKHFEWLGLQSLDFYLPQYNVAIECQGIQHFKAVNHFGGENGLIETKERDERKFNKCKENGIKIYYVNYDENVKDKIKSIIYNLIN